RTPRTNGMVERFNGRISDVLRTHHFHSGEDLEQTLLRYVQLYNHHLPQSALQSKTPMQAMRGWYDSHPHLFLRKPDDRAGLGSYVFASLHEVRRMTEDWRQRHNHQRLHPALGGLSPAAYAMASSITSTPG
ncbi:MAG TPA: integrase core domain-containing protein, partial [Candidatus Acidoferrales bacterium]|nr:integrase core domain-containing protein [Candidatus Acidoferrales bacterium]